MLGNEREGCDKGCGRRKDVPSLQDGPAINLCLLVDVQCSTTPSLTTVPSLTWLFSLLAFADTLENLFINYISGLD